MADQKHNKKEAMFRLVIPENLSLRRRKKWSVKQTYIAFKKIVKWIFLQSRELKKYWYVKENIQTKH